MSESFISMPAVLSVDDDTLDEMVKRASTPSLAALYEAGKKSGHIAPVYDYADRSPNATAGPTNP